MAFLKRTGLPLDTILYKGTAPANTDLMSGTVQLFMDPWTALLPLATSGRAKGVFVTSKERTPLAPNIPTTNEVGLKDFNLSSWYGAWAPKDTPDAVVNRLAAGMAEVSKDPRLHRQDDVARHRADRARPQGIRRLHQGRGRDQHRAAEGRRLQAGVTEGYSAALGSGSNRASKSRIDFSTVAATWLSLSWFTTFRPNRSLT